MSSNMLSRLSRQIDTCLGKEVVGEAQNRDTWAFIGERPAKDCSVPSILCGFFFVIFSRGAAWPPTPDDRIISATRHVYTLHAPGRLFPSRTSTWSWVSAQFPLGALADKPTRVGTERGREEVRASALCSWSHGYAWNACTVRRYSTWSSSAGGPY